MSDLLIGHGGWHTVPGLGCATGAARQAKSASCRSMSISNTTRPTSSLRGTSEPQFSHLCPRGLVTLGTLQFLHYDRYSWKFGHPLLVGERFPTKTFPSQLLKFSCIAGACIAISSIRKWDHRLDPAKNVMILFWQKNGTSNSLPRLGMLWTL